LLVTKTYRLLLFPLEGDDRCVAVVKGTIPDRKIQSLREWAQESATTPPAPAHLKESKKILKEEFDTLKPRLLASLHRQITKGIGVKVNSRS
jgi:hypothetical protein